MTVIGIIGGQLQGMEAVYLAKKAGMEAVVIDKDRHVPARVLADEFYHLDLLVNENKSRSLLRKFDMLLPATENISTLTWLNQITLDEGIPTALDMASYSVSSSKLRTNNLFAGAGLPIPKQWPECAFPIIVKPSGLSGSAGVIRVLDQAGLEETIKSMRNDMVIEEFLEGPSYSLEVIAHKGHAVSLQVTRLEFDAGYDCKRVIAGPRVGEDIEAEFYSIGQKIARLINLSGIMDIEIIERNGELLVLEIDARLPSQTPSAVYHSTGINMLQVLFEYWVNGKLPQSRDLYNKRNAVMYEHFICNNERLEVAGEHVLAGAGDLKLYHNVFFADVFISNFEYSPKYWVGTAIFVGKSEAEVWKKHYKSVMALRQEFGIKRYTDPVPAFLKEALPIDQIVL